MLARILRCRHTRGIPGSKIPLKGFEHTTALWCRLLVEPIANLGGKFEKRIETLVVCRRDGRDLARLVAEARE